MAIFKNKEKNIVDVIKNDVTGEVLLYRYPQEDFNLNSTLVVMPGEEAIFIKGGTIEQVFDSGTYQLSTNNYPFLTKLRNKFSGGTSIFSCVVYFVRKADSQEIKWGTETPIQVRDKVFNIRTEAKVRGSYKLRVNNPSLFLEKLIGNNISIQTQEEINKYFASEFQGKIKSEVSKYLNSLNQELIGIDAYIDEIANKISPIIDDLLLEYGLKNVKFSLAGLDIDYTKYDALDEAQMAQMAKIKNAQGDKAVMDTLGDDWSRQQSVNIMSDMANNPNGTSSMGAGMGMGIGAAAGFNAMAQDVFTQPKKEDPMELLTKLKTMLDNGLIEKEEYDAKKAEILSRM